MGVLSIWFLLLTILALLLLIKLVIYFVCLFSGKSLSTQGLSKAIFAVVMITFFPVMIILAAAKKA